ncbi:MAG: ATP-dependent DNA helicase RecQ [Pseudomonadota bacterium]
MTMKRSPLSTDVVAVLKQHFGFDAFLPGQREVIENLLAGRSAAAVFPTGGGKSLCYQLPALLLDGVTLVVSPLIALMKDQIDALKLRGIPARRLDGTLSLDEYREVMDGLRNRSLRLLYVAPERFGNERFTEAILQSRVSLFAIDEAHCISEWGHNFRPDYLKLAEFGRRCKAERILALTATATPKVLKDMQAAFDISPACSTCTGFYRPNLTLRTTPVTAKDRDRQLIERLRARGAGAAIVYVTLQRTAEQVARRLVDAGFPARAYHAGMKDDDRSAVQDWFLASKTGIVVATIAFGMGVDKPDIRSIFHYNLPKSLENYSQEIGRAGRDGLPSVCEMLVCPDDLNALENFAYGDTPTPEAVSELVTAVFSEEEAFDVSYYELSATVDIRILVVRTLLTYLELEGYLVGGTPFYATYQFKERVPSQEILAHFDEDRRRFLSQMFNQAVKARTWFSLDVDAAALIIKCPRERIVRALDYLDEQQMLEVKVQGVRNRYRRVMPCENLHALAASLYEKSLARERREIARLHQVLALAGGDGCHWMTLCEHFGEKRKNACGHCAWCTGGNRPVTIPPRSHPVPEEDLFRQVIALRRAHPQPLAHPQAAARFLCGVSSPKLSKEKLTSHPLFGAAAQVPFPDVLSRLHENIRNDSRKDAKTAENG